jgi:SAM-dependent methyltransferase
VANTYGPLLERVWRDALLLPGHVDLLRSLATEVGEFLGLSEDEAVAAMREAWDRRPQESRERFPSVVNEATLAEFYNDSSRSMLVSAYWHSLRPDRYALHSVAALHATQMYASGDRVFEVGHGIGSSAVLFARHGLQLTIGDVSDTYIAFARRRLAKRRLEVRSLDLRSEYPTEGSQDAIVCLDVLEHVLDPLQLVRTMVGALREDGLLVLNIAFGKDADTPEHLLHRRLGFLDRMRSLGLDPIPHPTLDLFWRRQPAKWEVPLRRVQDGAVASGRDVAARYPRVGRLLRRSVLPPLLRPEGG